MARLHLIVGPWGSGKSTLADELRGRRLGLVILDWDLIIPLLSEISGSNVHTDPSTWPALRKMWVGVVGAILANGIDVALLGPMRSSDLADEGFDVHEAYLDCSDDTLRARLTARGESPNAIEDELAMAADLRCSNMCRVDAERSIENIAADVICWLQEA